MNRKMVMAVVSRDQSDRVLNNLISAGYGATFTDSRGGMLRQAQRMLFVAAEADRVEDVVEIIRQACRAKVEVSAHESYGDPDRTGGGATTTTEVGYAVIFVWDLERFETY